MLLTVLRSRRRRPAAVGTARSESGAMIKFRSNFSNEEAAALVSSISLLAARDALVQNASGHRTAFLRRSDRFRTDSVTDRFRTGLFLGENSDYSSVGQSYVRRYQASDSPSKRRTVLPTLPSVGQTSEHRTFERCYGSLHTLLGAARVRYRPCQRRC